jgi:hypothetical protein
MGPIRVIAAPIRRLTNSRLFQLVVVLAIILALDHYSYDYSALRRVAEGLKTLVTASVALFSDLFRVGILTDPVLQVGLMIAYVYVVCLLIFLLLRFVLGALIDRMGRSNFLWLRNAIASERGIAAYRAWLPLERIRPPGYPQDKWEAEFAWPPDNKPPYPPLPQRALRAAVGYLAVLAAVAIVLQLLTPFPVLTWIRRLI